MQAIAPSSPSCHRPPPPHPAEASLGKTFEGLDGPVDGSHAGLNSVASSRIGVTDMEDEDDSEDGGDRRSYDASLSRSP
eukprot:2335894-Pyramimonas_sp.AAC.1